MTWWSELSEGLRVAIVAAMAGIAAAIVNAILPIIRDYLRQKSDLNIIDISSFITESSIGVDILVSNNSTMSHAVSNLKIELWQYAHYPLNIIGASTYKIEASLDVLTGKIDGKVMLSSSQSDKVSYSYKVSGALIIPHAGGWRLSLDMPLRDEISANGHLSIRLIFPDNMKIATEPKTFGSFFPPLTMLPFLPITTLGKYMRATGGQYANFSLARFLLDRGSVGIELRLDYSTDKAVTTSKVLVF